MPDKTTIEAKLPPERKLFLGAISLISFVVALASMFDGNFFEIDATTVALLGVAALAGILFAYPNLVEFSLSGGQVSIKLDRVTETVQDVHSNVDKLDGALENARHTLERLDNSFEQLQSVTERLERQNKELGQLITIVARSADLSRLQEGEQAALEDLAEEMPPALTRPVVVEVDPEKGRWGGLPERDGWILSASFGETTSLGYVAIHLKVSSTVSDRMLEGRVTFYLHPTFEENKVITVSARGGVADTLVRAWGGFTVGAWLHIQKVELELDLAELPYAPRVIKEL
jgi:hypothetical protein